ncbi:hypothetical protein AYI68_g2469 [Smittium mucronatum]|uniref:Uncharacterized protein n=1 Tax=Smittium mucronatum TaxID=133383 RepID=A0A1R0H2Q0_9FUNG|nr:hypothetical protein AYI68_g2469 [Smittium mucronatum]
MPKGYYPRMLIESFKSFTSFAMVSEKSIASPLDNFKFEDYKLTPFKIEFIEDRIISKYLMDQEEDI